MEDLLATGLDESGQTVLTRVSEMDDIQDLLESYAAGSLYMAEAIAPQSAPYTQEKAERVHGTPHPPNLHGVLIWCAYFRFGLIVTGDTEREHRPKLFKSLMSTGICHFEVIRKIEQRSPRTSSRQRPPVVGTNQTIERKDELEIGLPARGYVNRSKCHFVLLIDDLEYDRRDQQQQVFDRYRLVLDTVLNFLKHRASVHFLVNMLETYYFADTQAINAVLETSLPDYEGDVETIRNPKNLF